MAQLERNPYQPYIYSELEETPTPSKGALDKMKLAPGVEQALYRQMLRQLKGRMVVLQKGLLLLHNIADRYDQALKSYIREHPNPMDHFEVEKWLLPQVIQKTRRAHEETDIKHLYRNNTDEELVRFLLQFFDGYKHHLSSVYGVNITHITSTLPVMEVFADEKKHLDKQVSKASDKVIELNAKQAHFDIYNQRK